MIDEGIVGQLFAMFKERYGCAVDDATGLFDAQRDMLEFVMRLGKSLERKFFEDTWAVDTLGPSRQLKGWSIGSRATDAVRSMVCSARSC